MKFNLDQKFKFIHLDLFILLEQELDCLIERAQTQKVVHSPKLLLANILHSEFVVVRQDNTLSCEKVDARCVWTVFLLNTQYFVCRSAFTLRRMQSCSVGLGVE